MKKNTVSLMITLAFCSVINIAGAQAALYLKIPIYLDTIGTFFAAFLLGPVYGMVPGLISGILTGITLDIYSLYFIPVQLLTGFTAGIIYKRGFQKGLLFPVGTLMITLPGTLAASLISAFLFGGFTSSGSSLLVLFLRKLGAHEVLSVFIVQLVTDYLDRFLSLSLVMMLLASLPKSLTDKIRRSNKNYGKI